MASTTETKTILIVDDEPAVRALLRECFEMEGYRVVEAADSSQVGARLAEDGIGLITLDLNLGGDNGLELARQIRASRNVPIVMITGKGDMIDRVVGLELGADDYITKPFHVREVLARVRAVLRRYEGTAAVPAATPVPEPAGLERYAFDRWVLDVPKRELSTRDGQAQELTTAEFNMLAMFVQRPHRVLSRDNIMDLLKGHEWSPYDRSIDSLIVRVRRKIEASPDAPKLIKTVRGVGYVLACEVQKL